MPCLFACLPVSIPSESHSGDSAGDSRLRLSLLASSPLAFCIFACLVFLHALSVCLLACADSQRVTQWRLRWGTALQLSFWLARHLHFASLLALCFRTPCLFACLPVPIPSESHSGDSAGDARLYLSSWLSCHLHFASFACLVCLYALLLTLPLLALLLACLYLFYLLVYPCFISCIMHA